MCSLLLTADLNYHWEMTRAGGGDAADVDDACGKPHIKHDTMMMQYLDVPYIYFSFNTLLLKPM